MGCRTNGPSNYREDPIQIKSNQITYLFCPDGSTFLWW
jgi:hypothetical protein